MAERPGITQSELSELLDMPQGTVSRNLKLLNRYFEQGQSGSRAKGYGLLVTRPLDGCTYPLGVYLTAKGDELILDVTQELRSVPTSGFVLTC